MNDKIIDEMRKLFFKLVEPTDDKHDKYHYFDVFIMTLIFLNVLAIILASDRNINAHFGTFFKHFEIFSVLIFTIEYLLRLWTIVEKDRFKKPILGRIKFMATPMAIVDLLAILPFYLPFVGIDLRFLRILRIFRIFRLLKMARYSSAFSMIKGVLREKKEELMVTLMFILIILVIISTLMFYVERDAQPDTYGSIPKAIWWGVVTLTTVGYGDVYPITVWGKILGGIITLLGIGLIALPSGILASGYTEQINRRKKEGRK